MTKVKLIEYLGKILLLAVGIIAFWFWSTWQVEKRVIAECALQHSKQELVVKETQEKEAKNVEVKKSDDDKASGWWGVLGFFVPLAGLILFLVWMNDKPKTARKCGLGALISVCVGVVSTILYFVLIVILGPAIFGSLGIAFGTTMFLS